MFLLHYGFVCIIKWVVWLYLAFERTFRGQFKGFGGGIPHLHGNRFPTVAYITLFCKAYKVETCYTHGQRVDLLYTPTTSSQNILVPLFFFFFLSLQLAKIKILLLQNFQHTSDGYGRGYVSFAHSLLYFITSDIRTSAAEVCSKLDASSVTSFWF